MFCDWCCCETKTIESETDEYEIVTIFIPPQIQNDAGRKEGEEITIISEPKNQSSMTAEIIQKLLVNRLNRFDKDGRGELDYAEFKEAFLSLGLNGSEAEIREIFKQIDVDTSGKVSQAQFSQGVICVFFLFIFSCQSTICSTHKNIFCLEC